MAWNVQKPTSLSNPHTPLVIMRCRIYIYIHIYMYPCVYLSSLSHMTHVRYTLYCMCVVHIILFATHVEISEFRNPWPPKKKAMPSMEARLRMAKRLEQQVVVVGWSGDACLSWVSGTFPSNQLRAIQTYRNAIIRYVYFIS